MKKSFKPPLGAPKKFFAALRAAYISIFFAGLRPATVFIVFLELLVTSEHIFFEK